MKSTFGSFAEYVDAQPDNRREALRVVRDLILETVPDAVESMRYGMPTYDVAGDFLAALASQKHYLSLYVDSETLAAHREDFGHLNCGKSCIRFRRLEQLPLEAVRRVLRETAEQRRGAESR
ncbi:MAG: DUF1801 domain-containing protein [Caldilineae bacterium]|nr:MAG: DUF1801 domain-containing protein [Caldilineae bacterium]